MALKYGPSSISSGKSSKASGGGAALKDVRVKDIILSPNHPRFEEVGGWSGLGTIIFDDASNPSLKSSTGTQLFAKPYFSNSKFFPLINEIVAVVAALDPIRGQESKVANKIFYYFPPVNSWNSQHHNAIPDASVPNPLSSRKSYDEVSSGMVNRSQNEATPIILGTTFKEKENITPLFPYEGDYILEGRWGNSIRFGSTVTNFDIPNNWSSEGEEGDPIILIRNGNISSPTSGEGWVPSVENINDDASSIYLTSTQQVPFFASSYKTDSFGPGDESMSPPSEYQGNQILINSGRVLLNAKTDGILLSSTNVIHLSAGSSVNLDCADKIVLSSGKVFLVDRNASERAVLGEALVLELKKLLPALSGLAKACSVASAGPFPVPSLISIGPALDTAVNDLTTALNGPNPKILSNKVKLQ